MLNLKIIASSSKGNCYIIETKSGTLIIECGIKYKQILEALDFDLKKVIGCLISHEHKDHSRAVVELMGAGIDVYSSPGTFNALSLSGHRVKEITSLKQFSIGDFRIIGFDVKHDAAEPIGFLIFHPEFGKLLFATDTFYVKYTFKDLNYIMVECNYSKEILDQNIEAGKISRVMKRRLLSSHFSFENVKSFLAANDLSKVAKIYLLHLSDGNSNEAQFKNEIERLTGVPVGAGR